jgi:hypothetical protein
VGFPSDGTGIGRMIRFLLGFFIVFCAASIEGGSHLEVLSIAAIGLSLMFFGARKLGSLDEFK